MDTKNPVAWIARHAYLAVGLAMTGGDVATIVSWVRVPGIGLPLALGLMTFFTPLAVLALGAWIWNNPWRSVVRFRNLHDEIVACRDLLIPMMNDAMVVNAVGQIAVLQQKLAPLDIDLPVRDLYDGSERAKCWSRLAVLAASASVGNLERARHREGLLVGVSTVSADHVSGDVGGDDAEGADPDQHQHRGDDASGGGDWGDVAVADGGDGDE